MCEYVYHTETVLECFCHLPDAAEEVHLGNGHGDLQNTGGDPPLVLAVHQPPELGLAIGQWLDHGSSGAVLGPDGLGGGRGSRHVNGPAGLDVDIALVGRLEDQDKVSGRDNVTWATAGCHLVRHCHFIIDFLRRK